VIKIIHRELHGEWNYTILPINNRLEAVFLGGSSQPTGEKPMFMDEARTEPHPARASKTDEANSARVANTS
jgi:hypothetical protein